MASTPIVKPVDFVPDPSRVIEGPLVEPGKNLGLVDVFRRRYLLKLLVQKEIQARYNGSVLGLFWSYVQPAVRFLLYFFVIGIVLGLHRNVPNFAIHIFAGLVFVNYFTETFSSGTRAIVRNKAIVRKMAMPREMFPVAAMIVSAIHAFPQLLILAVGAWISGWSPDVTGVLAGFLGLAILALFGTGLALVFSAFNVFFRDFQNVVQTLTIFTHWAVPMIYPYSRLSTSSIGDSWILQVYLANPLAESVLLLQRAFWVGTCPDNPVCSGPDSAPADLYTRGLVMLVVGVVFLALCQMLFSRLEGKFAERL